MATELICRVVPGGLMASNKYEAEKLESFLGREVKAVISQPRNLAFHKKGFALLKAIYELADEQDLNFEQYRKWLVAAAGYCDFKDLNGEMICIPKSLSWGSMDELVFNKVYQDVLTFAVGHYHLDEPSLNFMMSFA